MRSGGAIVLSRVGVIHWVFLSFPRRIDSAIAGLEEAKNLAGKVLRLIQDRLSDAEFGKNRRQPVKAIRRKRESRIRVPETQSAFHPHAQRNAFRRRDVRPQSQIGTPSVLAASYV